MCPTLHKHPNQKRSQQCGACTLDCTSSVPLPHLLLLALLLHSWLEDEQGDGLQAAADELIDKMVPGYQGVEPPQ